MGKNQKELQNYLLLNQYLSSLFGFNSFEEFLEYLKNEGEDIASNRMFHFTNKLLELKLNPSFLQKLVIYDENIQEYLDKINFHREIPLSLKYFQYITVLLTEIYLDNYVNQFDIFYAEFLRFINRFNQVNDENDKIIVPEAKSMNKIAIWAATGSGKTIIMHIHILQSQKYLNNGVDNLLMITPNEGLSLQHKKELDSNEIENILFEKNAFFNRSSRNDPVKVIEITKIKYEVTSDDGKSIPVDAFGENNILFVDEGHKGFSTDAQVWKEIQRKLVKRKGFVFEYSATFSEITDNDDTFNEYALSILIDYRYKHFYDDGFGKYYQILNLKNPEDYADEYFTYAMLSFFEQKLYFEKHKYELKDFHIENPLMIFVGTYVSGKRSSSDVLNICKFLADFYQNQEKYVSYIESILSETSRLIDDKNESLSKEKYLFLKNYIKNNHISFKDVYFQIKMSLFHSSSNKKMEFIQIQNADGEIGLKFDDKYFGLINIGDVPKFLDLVKNEQELFSVGPKSNFERSLFNKIEEKDSSINFLIGSKKFIEGWNSYRVSSMGLLNIGKNQGSQIIQLFGRGVRLRGFDFCLMRTKSAIDANKIPLNIKIPEQIQLVETLNVFGINANYMSTFRESLKNFGIIPDQKITMKKEAENKNRMNNNDNSLNTKKIQDKKLNNKNNKIIIDLSAKIEIIDSESNYSKKNIVIPKKQFIIQRDILEILDYSQIYIDLLKYKELKRLYSRYFTKKEIETKIKSLSTKDYAIICTQDMLDILPTDNITKLKKIQGYITQVMKLLIDGGAFNYE